MGIFQFKQFSIQHEFAAMKVGTDAMLLGALCDFTNSETVLDIGTGTGVLSLMVAQRFNPELITAIELDEKACLDAHRNFNQELPFKTKFELLQIDINDFQSEKKFDGIISNPPYFKDSTISSNSNRTLARHTNSLQSSDLFRIVKDNLALSGQFWVIFPVEFPAEYQEIAGSVGLHLQQSIQILGKATNAVSTAGNQPIRMIQAYGYVKKEIMYSELTIRTLTGNYSEEYIELTREFHGKKIN